MVEATSVPYSGGYTPGIGCPICGMHVPRSPDNFYASVKGNQVVETCSAKHATAVVGSGPLPEPSANPDPGPKGTAMCVSGTVMFAGFRFTSPVCTIYLFEGLRISSAAGLVGALIATVLLGISVEAIHTVRKRYMKTVGESLTRKPTFDQLLPSAAEVGENHAERQREKRGDDALRSPITGSGVSGGGSGDEGPSKPPVTTFRRPAVIPLRAKVLNSLMFAGSLAIAYLLMLIAMTYNASLFMAVIVGLGMGHFLFSDHTVVRSVESQESVEPCCRV